MADHLVFTQAQRPGRDDLNHRFLIQGSSQTEQFSDEWGEKRCAIDSFTSIQTLASSEKSIPEIPLFRPEAHLCDFPPLPEGRREGAIRSHILVLSDWPHFPLWKQSSGFSHPEGMSSNRYSDSVTLQPSGLGKLLAHLRIHGEINSRSKISSRFISAQYLKERLRTSWK